jgi:hypothetical protein
MLAVLVWVLGHSAISVGAQDYIDLSVEVVEDKIRGGLLGQILGNLNGLPHEMKYLHEPGKVEEYIPSLPKGAHTDDDTDIEWVYLIEMQGSGEIFIPYKRIAELWRENMNRKVACANGYARRMMDLGLVPPLTGREALNPWSEFNISGQFLCEAFGLMAPAMPQTAAKIGVHYTHVAIDGEPTQTTQLFTAMTTAFVESKIDKILDAGLRAIDRKSKIRRVVQDVQGWYKQNPHDWKRTRELLRDKYSKHKGDIRDRNGYELNTASIIGALLYGKGDFIETILLAFNFGWDADCNAATAGTVVGVIKGRKWMDGRGWNIADVYTNDCRPGMPKDETITRYGDRLCAVARRVILSKGGKELTVGGKKVFRIIPEKPKNVEPLMLGEGRVVEMKKQLMPVIIKDLSGGELDRARAAYLAIGLDEAKRILKEHPQRWAEALEALNKQKKMIRAIFKKKSSLDPSLSDRATAAGVKPLGKK